MGEIEDTLHVHASSLAKINQVVGFLLPPYHPLQFAPFPIDKKFKAMINRCTGIWGLLTLFSSRVRQRKPQRKNYGEE